MCQMKLHFKPNPITKIFEFVSRQLVPGIEFAILMNISHRMNCHMYVQMLVVSASVACFVVLEIFGICN